MKKTNYLTVLILTAAAVVMVAFQFSIAAKEKMFTAPKIGVVSVKEIFEKCNLKDTIEKKLAAQGDKRFGELKELEDSLTADKEAMTKRKPNSADYLELMKDLMLKQSSLEAKKEFYQQELIVKEMQGKEEIYRKILQTVRTIAQEKGLDMIVSRDDNYLNSPDTTPPAQNPNELILATKTHKLLYFNSELDITAEILAEMNK